MKRGLALAGDLGRLRAGSLDVEVTAVTCDSRQVIPGALFVAVPGSRGDGRAFAADALARGAAGIVFQGQLPPLPRPAALLEVADARRAAAILAERFYDHPSRRLDVVGITGTNGKTTTTHILRSILETSGARVALIGTIAHSTGRRQHASHNTTPGPVEIQALLAEAVAEGCRWAVMEVSSHALDQQRVEAVRFAAAAFTGLTRDHLDYHRDFESYFQAKSRLFELAAASASRSPWGAVYADDPYGRRLAERFGAALLTYGREAGAVRLTAVEFDPEGLRATLATPAGMLPLRSRLVGPHNALNVAAAAATALVLEIPPETIAEGISRTRVVPGRFEAIRAGQPFQVIVDYAHTDDALRNLLAAVRQITPGRVITVFGAGGDRDRSKRPLMGRAAAAASDLVIVTSDNPRSEEPLAIIDEILAGVRRADRPHRVEPDRRLATGLALAEAGPGDTVVLAGKGHEACQIIGPDVLPYDDRAVARQLLAEMGYADRE